MSPRVKPIIKQFLFEHFDRRDLTIGPGTRVRYETDTVQLIGPPFSLAPDLFVKTRVTSPQTVKQWTGFYVLDKHIKDSQGNFLTSFGYRLSDGVTELYWDGAAWSPAGPGNWNTEAEVAGNIREYPIGDQKLQIVINPFTLESDKTPRLTEIRLSYDSDVDDFEDYIWRTLVPQLRAGVRPISDTGFRTTEDTTEFTIQLDNSQIKYDIVGIDAVYDLTADPRTQTDLFASYDVATTVVTLNATVPAGNVIRCRFIYQPVVAVTTDQDFTEVGEVPTLIITNMDMGFSPETSVGDFVIDKQNVNSPGVILGASMSDIAFQLEWHTGTARDHARITSEIRRFFKNNEIIYTAGTDDPFRLWLAQEYREDIIQDQKGLYVGSARARIVNAVFYDRDTLDGYPVLNLLTSVTTR